LKEDATTTMICRSINRNPSPFSLSFTHMYKADPLLTHKGKFHILFPAPKAFGKRLMKSDENACLPAHVVENSPRSADITKKTRRYI